jgi:outer membrane protein OmpA-like peptidoglycan-associated protein
MSRLIAWTLAALVFAAPAAAGACMPLMFYFDSGSSRLNADSRRAVRTVVDDYRALRGGRIRLIARTDGAGTADANMRLARRRGAAVKAELIRRGVPARAIDIDARGESAPAVANAEVNENDRVVVVEMVAAPAREATAGCH